MVSLEVGLDGFLFAVVRSKSGREFGGNDHLITIFLAGHPLAKPELALLILVVVGAERSALLYAANDWNTHVSIKLPPCSKK